MRIPDIPDFYERLAEIEVLDIETGNTSLEGVSMDDERLVKLRVLLELDTQTYRKRAEKGIRVIPITDYPERVENVDIKRIKLLMKDGGYKYKDLAEVLDISYTSIKKRMIGAVTFTADEIETLEDLFFLEEGELIKE